MGEKVGGEVSEDSDTIVARVNELNAEFDKLMVNGRQRRLIIEFAYRHGLRDGKDSERAEWLAQLQAATTTGEGG